MEDLSQLRRAGSSTGASPGTVLAVVCAGNVMANLDLFVVNVALPEIAADFGERELGTLSWVISAYSITYAALLVPISRIAERHRRDRAFLLGVAVFVGASVMCAVATAALELIAFRVVQAIGAAILTPASLTLVLASAPPDRRESSVRAWTAVGGVAAALGPVIGGLLTAADWRWVFLVNVPVGLGALVIGWRHLPAVPGHPTPRPDFASAVAVTGGVGMLSLGLVRGGETGWTSASTLAALAVAAGLLGALTVWTLRRPNPMVDPALFAIDSFRGASLALGAFMVAFGAMLLSLVLWMQTEWGWSALRTGLAVAPGPLMVPIVSFGALPTLTPRWGASRLATVGITAFAAGIAWWAIAVTPDPNYLGGVLGGLVVAGIGVGMALPTLMATSTSDLPPHVLATGSGVVNMFRQIGLAIGVAVLVAVLGDLADPLGAFRRAWWITTAIALGAAAVTRWMLPRSAGSGGAESHPQMSRPQRRMQR